MVKWKSITWAKSNLPLTNSVFEKVWFTINEPSKMPYFNFCLFPFFQISNDYCQKSYNGFWGLLWSSTKSQVFLIYAFLAMKRRFFYIFWNLHETAFCFIFFLNERNITIYPLMIYLKYTAVHYTNLNSSSVNNPFFKIQAVEYASLFFFRFLIYVYFNETFLKIFMKKIYFLI